MYDKLGIVPCVCVIIYSVYSPYVFILPGYQILGENGDDGIDYDDAWSIPFI